MLYRDTFNSYTLPSGIYMYGFVAITFCCFFYQFLNNVRKIGYQLKIELLRTHYCYVKLVSREIVVKSGYIFTTGLQFVYQVIEKTCTLTCMDMLSGNSFAYVPENCTYKKGQKYFCYRQRSIDILLHCEKKKLDLLTQLSDTLLRLSTCPSISLFFAVAG